MSDGSLVPQPLSNEEKERLKRQPWQPTEIPILPLLQQLNDWVIKQNEKRLPKWKFRFAADFAMQIHPRITRAYDMLFECYALQTDDLTVGLFTEPKQLRGRQYYRVRFDIRVSNGAWSPLSRRNVGTWWHAKGGT
jgi:hypothetical protein